MKLISPHPTTDNMASKDISEIHIQSCAILERLCNARDTPFAQPLEPEFIQEFFKVIQEELSLVPVAEDISARTLHSTEARLSGQDRGLLEVAIGSKRERFLVSNSSRPCK